MAVQKLGDGSDNPLFSPGKNTQCVHLRINGTVPQLFFIPAKDFHIKWNVLFP